ncbi:MAG: hypothetical protein WCO63_07605 [Bacteroidota bacterium]
MKEIPVQEHCLNCSYTLGADNIFCPSCGQKKLAAHDFTIRHIVVDSMADYFHFDGKMSIIRASVSPC